MTSRPTALTVLTGSAAALALTLGACGGGEEEADGASGTSAGTSAGSSPETDTEAAAEDEPDSDSDSGSGSGSGTVTVAGTTYTFTPSTCVFSPDDAQQFSVNGPGEAGDGTPAFVDAVGPNQLVVYVGTTDPFGEADTIFEVNPMLGGGGPMEPMGGLEASAGSVSATPVFYEVDASRTESSEAGEGTFEVTCG